MDNFYELLPDELHLNEYHEYYFFKSINKLHDNEIRKLQEYEHFDIRLLPFERSDQIKKDNETEKYCIIYPPQLFFSGDFHNSKIERTDYPIVDDYQLLVKGIKIYDGCDYYSMPAVLNLV